jgi:hypothetical protein
MRRLIGSTIAATRAPEVRWTKFVQPWPNDQLQPKDGLRTSLFRRLRNVLDVHSVNSAVEFERHLFVIVE